MADATAMAYLRGRGLGDGCRAGESPRFLVVVSKATETRKVEMMADRSGLADCLRFTPVFPLNAPAVTVEGGKVSVELSSMGAAIYSVQ